MTTCPIGKGSYGGYSHSGCRCPECTTANREYNRRYRQRPEARAKANAISSVANRRVWMADRWLKLNHPDVWAQLDANARAAVAHVERTTATTRRR